MRVLLIHPEDSPCSGSWSRERWDILVDLGRSSQSSADIWSGIYHCPVMRTDSYRHGLSDSRRVRTILSSGRQSLIDDEGIDWWEQLSLLNADQVFALTWMKAVSAEIAPNAEVWVTRRGWLVSILERLLANPIRAFQEGGFTRGAARAKHYVELFRRFSAAQLKQIILDKYDSGYRWRSRFTSSPSTSSEPVVLLPSAYANVSRMAAAYAGLLPDQRFLLVATRQSAKEFVPPANVQVQDLAAHASSEFNVAELERLMQGWASLRTKLQSDPDLGVLVETGVFYSLPAQIRDGLRARNAWRNVLDHEPVGGVLCGDDSNPYTRLPVLLASKRRIPTSDFHHGALDGRYVLKELPSDVYLAKNDMEQDYLVRVCGLPAGRIFIAAPSVRKSAIPASKSSEGDSAIFFSEPYELAGLRPDEVYRELLPGLCRLAREHGRSVVVKVHPFESRSQRNRIVRGVLAPEDEKIVTVIDGPLTPALTAEAWFGITIESTTVVDCLQDGVCCFLCGWLSLFPYEYTQQYARFGIGEILEDAEHIADIPRRLREFHDRPKSRLNLSPTVEPSTLQGWLTSTRTPVPARSLS